jgi:hypothetical protein
MSLQSANVAIRPREPNGLIATGDGCAIGETMRKQCSRCKVNKPLDEFYADRRKRDGRRSQCKACQRERNASNSLRQREYDQRHRMLHLEEIRVRDRIKKRQPSVRKRTYASTRICKAVSAGYIDRPDGHDFHHPDYDRPYYGAWVTRMEHRHIHEGLMNCPPCFDHESHILECQARTRTRVAIGANRKRWDRFHASK